MSIVNTGLSRRAFLGLGATAAVAAGAGLAGCAPQSNTSANNTSSKKAETSNWKTAPAEITNFAKTYDCDVVVCGHGFAGITACS